MVVSDTFGLTNVATAILVVYAQTSEKPVETEGNTDESKSLNSVGFVMRSGG